VKCLVLAAGYGTRMASFIGDRPKALVEIGGRTLLDRLLDDVSALGLETTIVTNDRHHTQFAAWQASAAREVTLLNDGSTHAGDRLGAIGDMAFAIRHGALQDDLLVLAADNLLSFSLASLVDSFRTHAELHLAVWHNVDREDQKRRGVVEIEGHRVVAFREKPENPSSAYAAAPIYLLPERLVDEPENYLRGGGNPDAPGHLMEHLVGRFPARAWHIPGQVLDVGNPESYALALEAFSGTGGVEPR